MKQLELDLRSTQERSRTWYDIVVDDRLRQREDVAFEEREFERSQTRAFWRSAREKLLVWTSGISRDLGYTATTEWLMQKSAEATQIMRSLIPIYQVRSVEDWKIGVRFDGSLNLFAVDPSGVEHDICRLMGYPEI